MDQQDQQYYGEPGGSGEIGGAGLIQNGGGMMGGGGGMDGGMMGGGGAIGGGGQGGGYSRGPRAGSALAPGQRYDTTKVSGKCFLGGLLLETTRESVSEYCSQWYVNQIRISFDLLM